MLRARIATAAVAIPLLLALILYPSPWPLGVLVVAVAVVGIGEYATMAFQNHRGERLLTMVLGTAVVLAVASQQPHLTTAALALVVVGGLIWTLFARPDFESGLADLGLVVIGILYVGILLPHFIFLHGLPLGPRWVIFVLVIGMAGDTAGYAVGHWIGRHKLAPRLSPGKTVEGGIGILLVSVIAAAAAKLILLPDSSWTEILSLGLVMAVIGQLGDLTESIMKRTFDVKESGWLFPGHGGVLDRIDSLLFPVAFLYYYLLLR